MKNQSNQTPHKIFTQHKTHFDYAEKKEEEAITFTIPNTPICLEKKKSKKSTTIKQNPDEKIKESTYIQKPQMRIHFI